MPLYDYECTMCKHRFEKNSSISSRDDDKKCPKCEKSSKRFMGKPNNGSNGFILKGGGWTGRLGSL